MHTFTIEIRVDFEDKEKVELTKNLVREKAKELYSATTMISEKRKPQIAIFGSDFFEGKDEISMEDDS